MLGDDDVSRGRADRLLVVMALALTGCAVDEDAPPIAAAVGTAPALALSPPAASAVRVESPRGSRSRAARRGVAADVAGTGEPFIMVAGATDADGAPAVPVYAQRDGGWRVIASGDWPAGASSAIERVEAVDLDGDGAVEVIAFGVVGDAAPEPGRRTIVYRWRHGDLVRMAEGSYDRAARALTIIDGDADLLRAVRRPRRARRVARERISVSLPGPDGALDVLVRPAGDASLLATIVSWNAELDRLSRAAGR